MTRPWYRRFPDNFIAGTVGLSLEEKGAYSLLLDLMYVRGGPVPDEPRFIAGVCGCSVRKWNAIRQRLLDLGKISSNDGFLTNHRAEVELENAAKTARNLAENGAKGGEKSAENRAAAKKFNGLAQAGLKHTRASLHQNSIKEGRACANDQTDGSVSVDRWKEEALFKACERIRGKGAPATVQRWSFPADVVAQARKELSH